MMTLTLSLLLLSKTEKAYLNNREQFSKCQQRDIRCRLNKKLRLLNQEFENSGYDPLYLWNDELAAEFAAAETNKRKMRTKKNEGKISSH